MKHSYANLKMRLATSADAERYFLWVNDPLVRANSLSEATITWEEHMKWFAKKLESQNTVLYIFELDETPVGQVRFDTCNGETEIDYSIAPAYRGKGLGKKVLELAIKKIKETKSHSLKAVVKASNSASLKVFQHLGFQEVSPEEALRIFILP